MIYPRYVCYTTRHNGISSAVCKSYANSSIHPSTLYSFFWGSTFLMFRSTALYSQKSAHIHIHTTSPPLPSSSNISSPYTIHKKITRWQDSQSSPLQRWLNLLYTPLQPRLNSLRMPLNPRRNIRKPSAPSRAPNSCLGRESLFNTWDEAEEGNGANGARDANGCAAETAGGALEGAGGW